MTKTAMFIKKLPEWRGDARVFELSEPVSYGWGDENGEPTTKYVIVSAVIAVFDGPETYIFPANEDGTPIEMGEMRGSYRGGLDHQEALSGLGFEIV